jgi:polysaccharide biosynthesis protein PslH
MNILQIAPKVPFPLLDGGAIGIFNITKHLSLRGHNITFVTFANDDITSLSEFRKYCNLITLRKDTGNKVSGLLKNIFSEIPYTHFKYRSEEFLELIKRELTVNHYDVVHLDHLHMSFYGSYIKNNFKIPVLLREHNFETLIWERLYNSETNIFKKIIYKNQYKKIKNYEPKECKKFDKCLMVTDADARNLLKEDSSIPVEVVPAGVDLKYFPVSDASFFDERTLLFVGSLDWFPNVDAFKWFYSNVFPVVKKRYPDVILKVVGKNPPDEIKNISDPSVKVLGKVDDVRPHFKDAHVCVVPLRIGGGMRIKILEMFAMKKAVVSTSVGAEGIDIENGKHLLIADTENEIADSISKYFEDKNFTISTALSGYELVSEKYSWTGIAEKLEKIYLEMINTYNEK